MIPALARTGGLAVALALLAVGLLARSTSAASSYAAWRVSAPSVVADRLVEVPAAKATAADDSRGDGTRTATTGLLVAAGSGIFVGRVAAGGSISWHERGTLPPADYALGLAAPASGPVAVYAGTEEGVYAAGSPWGPYRRLPFPGRDVHAIAVDPLDPATLWASSDEGPFVSTDLGRSWRLEAAGMRDPATSWALAYCRPPGGVQVLLATDDLGVYLREAGRWVRVSGQRAVVSLDPGPAGSLYASSMGDGVSVARFARRTPASAGAAPALALAFAKADSGLPSIDSGPVRGIHVDSVTAAPGGAAYAGTMTQGLAVTYDGGRSWRQSWPALGGGGDVWRVLDVGGELVAATDTGILTRSSAQPAGGNGSWWEVAVAAGLAGCLVLAVATAGAAYRSRRPRDHSGSGAACASS